MERQIREPLRGLRLLERAEAGPETGLGRHYVRSCRHYAGALSVELTARLPKLSLHVAALQFGDDLSRLDPVALIDVRRDDDAVDPGATPTSTFALTSPQ